ncbi:MAG TPA: hypothetical protein VD710_10335 [Nitrososphaeraceae archaeon]|nr:hypothetical protein [Nitrososphaeraceae archaeon]
MVLLRRTDKTRHGYTNTILVVTLASILLSVISISNGGVFATHLGTSSSDIWGIEAAILAKMHHFDPSTDTTTAISRVPTHSGESEGEWENGRGIASDGTNLWYTVLIDRFKGDGKIHKIAPTGGADIGTIPDPFGFNRSGVNSLDFDSSGYLWGISSWPVQLDNDPAAVIFKIDSNTGTVLASCYARTHGDWTGPLAIVNGKILTRTNSSYNQLTEYHPPSSIGDFCVPTGNVFTLPVEVSGIDTDNAGNLLVTDFHSLYNLGHAPYNTILASQPNAFYPSWEIDITTQPESDVEATVCKVESVQHWDKIVFMVTDPRLASQTNVSANTELDIKVLDDPQKVANLKQKVLDFLGAPNGNKNAIKIIDVEYAIICATQPPPSNDVLPPDFPDTNTPSVVTRLNLSNPLTGIGVQAQDVNKTLQSPP